ncbi:hypothetical protein LN042_35555 [Kitasatospora sp. RB6PN24]|uniref:hypothetical protein n=1 Tax=Kitasatospora humi TaxID=2893891 RepID=UPI001E2EF3C1|nr:hypothetical protein [Kitasatospora humi]MCC9312317.1 hypothetical protein [Kitasatospora humi]
MNDNYASLIISLDAAILLVGTVQYATLMKRAFTSMEVELRRFIDRNRDLFGEAPESQEENPERNRALRRLLFQVLSIPRSPAVILPFLASVTWLVICWELLGVVIGVLRWQGTENHGPDPELVQVSYGVTVVAVIILTLEGIFRVFVETFRKINAIRRESTSPSVQVQASTQTPAGES